MNPFIETNCFLMNKRLADLDVKTEDVPAKIAFLKSAVDSFREILDDDGEVEKDECVVYMRSGDTFVIQMSYNNLKEKLSCR